MARTGCECPLAGYCNRHGVTKTPHEHVQCQHNPTFFKKWEEGRGPGQEGGRQEPPPKKKEPEPVTKPPASTAVPVCPFCHNQGCNGMCRNNQKTPSMMQMAKNFAGSMKDAAKDGFKGSGEDLTKERLEICAGCEFFIPDQQRCSKCGCAMAFKTRLRSASCPIGKW